MYFLRRMYEAALLHIHYRMPVRVYPSAKPFANDNIVPSLGLLHLCFRIFHLRVDLAKSSVGPLKHAQACRLNLSVRFIQNDLQHPGVAYPHK